MIKTTLRKVGNKLNVISELHVIEQLGRSEKKDTYCQYVLQCVARFLVGFDPSDHSALIRGS